MKYFNVIDSILQLQKSNKQSQQNATTFYSTLCMNEQKDSFFEVTFVDSTNQQQECIVLTYFNALYDHDASTSTISINDTNDDEVLALLNEHIECFNTDYSTC